MTLLLVTGHPGGESAVGMWSHRCWIPRWCIWLLDREGLGSATSIVVVEIGVIGMGGRVKNVKRPRRRWTLWEMARRVGRNWGPRNGPWECIGQERGRSRSQLWGWSVRWCACGWCGGRWGIRGCRTHRAWGGEWRGWWRRREGWRRWRRWGGGMWGRWEGKEYWGFVLFCICVLINWKNEFLGLGLRFVWNFF